MGNKNFVFDGLTSFGKEISIVCKLIKIGHIKIHYYETDYDKGFQGKLRSIGGVKCNYFIENAINKKAGIVGEFKRPNGERLKNCNISFSIIKQ